MSKKKTRRTSDGYGYVGDMMSMGVGNMVGVGLIGATSEMTNALPTGTAKTIAGMAPAFQSTALLGHNIGYVKKSLGSKGKKDSYW